MKRYSLVSNLALFLILSVLIYGQKPKDMPDALNSILQDEVFRHAQLAFSVIAQATSTPILKYNENIALIPASSQKLLTTLTALHFLGQDFRYKTRIVTNGEILDDGTLMGDLVIIGDGDPSLGSYELEVPRLDEIMRRIGKAVMSKGIKCIDGMIICEAGIFDRYGVAESWPWDDLTNYYASGAYGLNINDNSYELYFGRSKATGTMTSIESINPIITGLRLNNEVVIGEHGSGDNAYLYGDPYGYERLVRGTIPPGDDAFKIKGAIPNPPSFFLNKLSESLTSLGINNSGLAVNYNYSDHESIPHSEIIRISSPDISEIIRVTNHLSINLYAEALLKTLGSRNGKQGSFDSGISEIISFLKSLGIDTGSVGLKDGSGLSPQNRISSRCLSEFMSKMLVKYDLQLLKRLIPRAGYDGSVQGFLKNTPAEGKVWLKSGSMEGVVSYTGFMTAKSGRTMALSIISNGHRTTNANVRYKFEKIFNFIYLNY